MAFIFQSKPSIYPLKTKLKVDLEVGWIASRYRDYMKLGEIVYYWSAGNRDERGIYGWGEITSTGAFIDSKGISRVAVTCRMIFPKHINISLLLKNPALKDLQIIRSAMGTNFLLTKEEKTAINNLIQGQFGGPFVPPNN